MYPDQLLVLSIGLPEGCNSSVSCRYPNMIFWLVRCNRIVFGESKARIVIPLNNNIRCERFTIQGWIELNLQALSRDGIYVNMCWSRSSHPSYNQLNNDTTRERDHYSLHSMLFLARLQSRYCVHGDSIYINAQPLAAISTADGVAKHTMYWRVEGFWLSTTLCNDANHWYPRPHISHIHPINFDLYKTTSWTNRQQMQFQTILGPRP